MTVARKRPPDQPTRSGGLLRDLLVADLGQDLGGGLSEREVAYLKANEWAETAEDILWRRSKLGLHLDESQRAAVAACVGAAAPAQSARAG